MSYIPTMKGSWYEKPYLDEQHLALTGICVQVHVYKASCLKHLIVCLLFCFVDFVEIQGSAFCQIRDSNFLQYATPFPDKPRWAYLPRTTLKSDLLCIVTMYWYTICMVIMVSQGCSYCEDMRAISARR